MKLKPCPCCGEEARYIKRGDFHLSFAIYDEPDTVEHNFLHDRAIQCSNCCLTMPEMDPEHPDELAIYWNERAVK